MATIEEYFDELANDIVLTGVPREHGLVLTEVCKQAAAEALLDAFIVGNGYLQRGLGGPIERLDPVKIKIEVKPEPLKLCDRQHHKGVACPTTMCYWNY